MDKILHNKLQCRPRGFSMAATLMAVMAVLMLSAAPFNRAAAALSTTSDGNLKVVADDSLYRMDPFNMDLSDITTGAPEKHITCYPNPAISYINFKFDKSVPKDARLFVFSFTGKQMEELAITGQIQKITLDRYYRGLYVYQLRSAGGAILESGKFQVKN